MVPRNISFSVEHCIHFVSIYMHISYIQYTNNLIPHSITPTLGYTTGTIGVVVSFFIIILRR